MQRTSNTETGAVDSRTGTVACRQLYEKCIVPDEGVDMCPLFMDAGFKGNPGPVLTTQNLQAALS